MIIASVCPKCGATLPARTPGGLCSKCVFEAMMSDGDEVQAPAGSRRIGDFEIIETIARGGMGIVYRARQVSLNRTVALKLITAADAASPDFLERFRTEAEAAASLNHPGIVAVYGFGTHEEQSFLAMEFIDGSVLGRGNDGQKLGALQPEEAARIVSLVARAVHHAHQRGILHRDIKPGNILLDAAGEPHLTDFGLAKLVERDSAITRTTAVMGTPSFMAPEQAAGKSREITTAADIYGLGAVLYNLLTGEPPFAGGTTLETIRQVLDQEPKRPSLLNSAVDRDLETICLKCLQKLPAQRYGSAEALAEDLERWRKREPILARPVTTVERMRKWVRRHRALAALLATSIVALVGVAVISSWMNVRLTSARRTIAAQDETRRKELVALHVTTGTRLAEEGDPFAALESFAEAARLDAANPDRLAMHRFRFELTQAHAPQLAHTFSPTSTATSVSFSPNGQRALVASNEGETYVWDAVTGMLISSMQSTSGAVRWAGFTRDGAQVLTRTSRDIVELWRADTGELVAGPWKTQPPYLRKTLLGPRDGIVWALALSTDGRWLALPGSNAVILQPVSSSDLKQRSFPTAKSVNQILFSPDDSQLIAVLEGGGVEIHDAKTGELIRVIEARRNFRNAAWSPDGTKIVLATDNFEARLYDPRSGSLLAPAMGHGAMVAGSQFTTDSRVLATWSFDNYARLFYADTGLPLAPPLRHQGPVRAASLSADGLSLATASMDGDVRWWNAKTGEARSARLPHSGAALDVAFSPDGQNLLTASAQGGARLWKISSQNFARWAWLQSAPIDQANFSPDGRRVAVGSLNEIVNVYDAENGTLIGAPLRHPARGVKAGWLDERRLATFDAFSVFRIWDSTTGQLLSTNAIPSASGTFYGRYFLAIRPNRAPEIWDAASGQRRFTLAAEPREGIVLRADLLHFLAVRGREIRVKHVRTGAEVHPVLRLPHSAWPVAISADSRRVAVAYSDNTVSIWNPATGKQVAGPMKHLGTVRHIAFTPNGSVLLTTSHDRALRLWDATTGEPLGPPLWHPSYVLQASMRSDGRAFATACSDGSARVWEIPHTANTVEDMQRVAHRLSGKAE